MRTLADHTIIYDDECPMCRMYTAAFVETGMLDAKGREAYTEVVGCDKANIDWDRARNEIALINRTNNSVQYGPDSLMTIIGHSMPLFKPLFRNKMFHFLVKRLYFFISYNRKVIAPGIVFEARNACTPDLNYGYRCVYIVFAWLITSLILTRYAELAIPIIPPSSFSREFVVCGTQIVFQGTLVGTIRKDRLIHYLGNVMTVSLGGALLLTPMFLISGLPNVHWFSIGYFMIVVSLMFFEHKRRVAILELPWHISASWILYRFIALSIILSI